jgi:5'-3' exoribonuclease 2
MLGIATHEPHFRVLREDVFANETKPGHCRKCNQPGHKADECRGTAKPKVEGVDTPLKPFIWLHVGVLREYLAVEMHVPNQPFEFLLERALDDWVFMCFFVGNDFLPHLPSLDIREDGIDTLIAIWRDNIPVMGGYVTKDGHVDLARAQIILGGLAKQEDAIFKRRREGELRKEANAKRRAEQDARRQSGKRMRFSDGGKNGAPSGFDETVIRRGARGGIIRGEAAPDINALPTFAPGAAQTKNDPRYAAGLTHADIVGGKASAANVDNRSAAAAMKEKLMLSKKPADNQKAGVDALFADGSANGGKAELEPVLGKRTRDMIDGAADDGASSDPSTPGRNTPNKDIADPVGAGTSGALGGNSTEDAMPEDTVKLWEEGYEGRYYEQKFHVSTDDIDFRHKVANSYVEGLCWVLLYYFQGCPSWTWYYPFHYAPFAADFQDIDKMKIDFNLGKPFRPYEQLMGVMPPASNHTLPKPFHPLMTDEDSPIKEFYPLDFEVDLNGKKFAWQGVALLPWIDEKRLLDAMGTKYPELTEDEHRRNAVGEEALIFSTNHPLYEEVAQNFYGKRAGAPKFKLNPKTSHQLLGKVSKDESFIPESELVFPFESGSRNTWTGLDVDGSMTVNYHMPLLSGIHKSALLPGVQFNAPMLDLDDVKMTRERAGRTGRGFGGVQLSQNGDRSDGRRINYSARENGGGYGGNNGYGGQNQNQNQFANQAANAFASLPPHLAQQAAMHGFAPGQGGMPPFPPPMPQGMPPQQQQQGYGSYPPRQQNGYEGRGGGGGYRGGYQQDYGRGGGGGGYDNRGYGGGYGGGGGYQGGRGGGRGGRRY